MQLLNIDYEKYKLKNGLEVILHHNASLPLVAVNLWYRVGSSNEKKGKTGIAHLFEHMMFQGSQNVPKEIHFRYIQEAGGTLNGSTSFDRTNYYEKVPSNYLDLALWLESDRMGFLLPALTQEKLTNQIGVVSNERLERYDNQPYGLAWEILISNLYPEGHLKLEKCRRNLERGRIFPEKFYLTLEKCRRILEKRCRNLEKCSLMLERNKIR